MTSPNLKVRLAVFDWAGTTIDFGSSAPAAAFKKVFASHGVEVTDDEARRPMGLNKREHLVAMLSEERVAGEWQLAKGTAWTEADVTQLYDEFVPFQLDAIRQNSQLVPGLASTVDALKAQDIKIGATTGYFRAAADLVTEAAKQQGFVPDSMTCADDVPKGRPAPWMIFRLMQKLNIYPPQCVVKIGDTVADVEAGRNAGCWTVGVCSSSSMTGCTEAEYFALSQEERSARLANTKKRYEESGSHFMIDSLEALPSVVQQINQRLASGDNP